MIGTNLQRWRRSAVVATVFGAVALFAAACGSSPSASASSGSSKTAGKKTTGTITIGTTLAPTTLTPATGTSGADYQYLGFIFDRLIQYNAKTGKLEPMLATSWHFVGTTKLTLDVTLRHGVKFQDGTAFNAAAVVDYSNTYLKDGDVINALEYVTSVTAVNTYEVAYHLSQQNAQLPDGLATRGGMIESPSAVAKEGKTFATHPVGAGPYSFVSQNPGASYSFTRFTGYWNNAKQPRVKNITFKIFSSDTALTSAVKSGVVTIDGYAFAQDKKTLKATPNLTVAVGPGTGIDMVYFNGKLKPFTSPKVRLAFNLALTRKAISNAATDGLGKAITEVATPGTFGYSKAQTPVWKYNPKQAKKLMAQAGYSSGTSVTCYTYPGLGYTITAPIIIKQEKAVGININVKTGTPSQVVPFYTKTLSPCYLSGWATGANPVTTYEGILWSKSYYNAGKTNWGADQYITKFFTTYTTSGYNSLFTGINKVMKAAPGYAPIYRSPSVIAYKKNIKGWIVSPFGIDYWTRLYFTK